MRSSLDRDLSCFSDLAIAVADEDGHVISSSHRYAVRLGRSLDEVVGRELMEWIVTTHEPGRFEQDFADVLAGASRSRTELSNRTDGRITVSRATMIPTWLLNGKPAVMGVHSAIFVPTHRRGPMSLTGEGVTALVGDVATELGTMAAQGGLGRLSESLESVVGTIVDSVRGSTTA